MFITYTCSDFNISGTRSWSPRNVSHQLTHQTHTTAVQLQATRESPTKMTKSPWNIRAWFVASALVIMRALQILWQLLPWLMMADLYKSWNRTCMIYLHYLVLGLISLLRMNVKNCDGNSARSAWTTDIVPAEHGKGVTMCKLRTCYQESLVGGLTLYISHWNELHNIARSNTPCCTFKSFSFICI